MIDHNVFVAGTGGFSRQKILFCLKGPVKPLSPNYFLSLNSFFRLILVCFYFTFAYCGSEWWILAVTGGFNSQKFFCYFRPVSKLFLCPNSFSPLHLPITGIFLLFNSPLTGPLLLVGFGGIVKFVSIWLYLIGVSFSCREEGG